MSSPENYNDLEKMGELQAKLQEISKNSLKQKKTGNKQAWSWKNSWLDQNKASETHNRFRSLTFIE